MNEIDKLKKQKEKLEQELKDKVEREKLESEVNELQKELKNNKARKDKLNSIYGKLDKGFKSFQRFADRYGSDVEDVNKLLGGESKKKKAKK